MRYYVVLRAFDLPNSSVRWAIDPQPTDGKILLINGSKLFREDTPWSHTFTEVGDLVTGAPGMLRISPSGSKAVAVALDGGGMWVFNPASGAITRTISQSGYFFYDAEWIDDNKVAATVGVTGEGPVVRLYDLAASQEKNLVRNIGAASGGVTIDSVGRLYTGNGYSSDGGDETGLIKAYERAAWEAAWNTNSPIDFEAAGLPVVNLLSGAYLGFDRYDNLYVGGGDVFGSAPDSNYAAVVYRAALDAVFAGGGMTTEKQPLDPDPQQNMAWSPNANRLTGELVLTAYESPKCYSCLLADDTLLASGEREVLFLTNLHLGDTPDAFPGTAYVGMSIGLTVPLPALDTFDGDFFVRINAREVENWGGTIGHKVTFGGIELVRFADPANAAGPNDRYSARVPRATYEAILAAGSTATLRVDVHLIRGGGSDDFILVTYGYRVTPRC